jgi:hypothetical protein
MPPSACNKYRPINSPLVVFIAQTICSPSKCIEKIIYGVSIETIKQQLPSEVVRDELTPPTLQKKPLTADTTVSLVPFEIYKKGICNYSGKF